MAHTDDIADIDWLDPRQQRAWRALQQMTMRLNAELARDLSAHSVLTYTEYAVLVALTDDPSGTVRINELASSLGWEQSRLSHQLARMVERRLVSKQRCGVDRRGAFVAVTSEGRAAIEAAAPSHVLAVRRLFIDRLTPRQLDSLGTAARAVLQGLDDATTHL